ncbi:uncharacterized protein LOC122862117 [Siniperca chuatsi]|uniref:uncharacterized protein LOC122862117 n=1 Tax=Siniperca chuatsi TaxID=119488 RepID=UPI001CE214B3|nr:uncharacterized protein LOC122862117 [Siniperca chuatsi]
MMFFTVGCVIVSHYMQDSFCQVGDHILGKAEWLVFFLHMLHLLQQNHPQSDFEAQFLAFPVSFYFLIYSQSLPCCVKMICYPGHQKEIQGPATVVQICSPVAHLVVGQVCSLCNKLDELQLLVRRLIFIFCFMFHRDMAVWSNTGLCTAFGRLPTLQSRLRHRTFQQNERPTCRTHSMLTNQMLCVERTNPNSSVISLSDFNKGNLSHELPKYRQFIKCPTREENILDHCHTTLGSAYHAVPRTALGHSDYIMVHLIPTYRQKLKLCKPVVRTSKQCTSEAMEDLWTCLDCTDWDIFRTAVWMSSQTL